MENIETEIGGAAGKVWQALHTGGPQSKAKIAKDTGLSPDILNQAIGWLAREGKLVRRKDKKGDALVLK